MGFFSNLGVVLCGPGRGLSPERGIKEGQKEEMEPP